jgi:subtilisin family serine protease
VRRVVVAAVTLAALVAPVGVAPAWAENEGPPGEWWYRAMAVDELHEQATGEGVTIAVLDGPVDPTVPDLRGQDVTPVRSFCGSDSSVTAKGPEAEHATSMASMLVGSGRGNGPHGGGIRGIAPDASVRMYSVIEDRSSTGEIECAAYGETLGSRMAAAVDAAVLDGADVISVSLAVSATERLEAALNQAQHSGVAVVGAAGDGGVSFPGNHPGAIAVGAVNEEGRASSASASGSAQFVMAPGVGLISGSYDERGWHSYGKHTGSSLSTALVAGVLALVKEKYPEATGWQLVRHTIYNTTDDELSWDGTYGFGVVSGRKMLADDPTRWRDSNPFVKWQPKYFIGSEEDELTGPDATATPSESAAAGGAASSGKRSSESGVPAGVWVAGGVAALVVGGAAVVTLLRGRSTRTVRDEPHVGSGG